MDAAGEQPPGRGKACPRCHHVSSEQAPKFCSECGASLRPAARGADSENNNSLLVSAPEGETELMELGEPLKEDGGPSLSLGPRDWEENASEPSSDASWTIIRRGVSSEVFVDALDGTSDAPEAALSLPGKRRKADGSPRAGADLFPADSEQSKRKRRRTKGQKASAPPDSAASSLCSFSLNSLSSLGTQGSAAPRGPEGQGGAPGQGQPPADGGSPLHAPTAPGKTAAALDGAERSPAVQDPGEVQKKDQDASVPPGDTGVPPRGAGSLTSACEGQPQAKDAAQGLPLPASTPDTSEPSKEEPRAGQPAGTPASGEVGPAAEPGHPGNKAGQDKKDTEQKAQQLPAPAPAPREHPQEATANGKSADPGEEPKKKPEGSNKDYAAAVKKKEEEEPKKKPEGSNKDYAAAVKSKKEEEEPKKQPEGSNKDSAAAVKSKKEERNQKARAQEAAASPPVLGEGVTVYFHAILSKDFAFNPDCHRVFVRGGEKLGRPKWKDTCEMHCTQDLHEHGFLIEGSLVIPKQSLDQDIPYKYYVYNGKGQYEFIYKQPEQGKHEHVNRCLRVRSALLGSGDWHQYDDIVCMKPSGMIRRFVDILTNKPKELVRGKQIAAGIMLDRVFSILQPWSPANLSNFFSQFLQFYAVTREPMVYEGQALRWKDLCYAEQEVKKDLWCNLQKKMEPFLKGRSGDPLPAECVVRSPLHLGLVLLFIARQVRLAFAKSDLSSLCRLLGPSASSPHALHSDLRHVLSVPQRWREFLVDLCQRCMDEKVSQWLVTLPVLHYCMQLPPPRKDCARLPEDSWAALEGFSFAQFREGTKEESQMLQLMEKNRHLLALDPHLFRSWFSLLPLRSLVGYMGQATEHLSHEPTRVLDCFLGTLYRLQGLREVKHQNAQDLDKIFEMLLHLVDIYQAAILEEPLLQTYLTVCLALHEAACTVTKDRKFYQLPALSVELFRRVIGLKPLVGAAAGPEAEATKSLVTSAFQSVLATTRSWLHRVFKERMFRKPSWSQSHTYPTHSVQFTYEEEMEVWRRLVEVDFPVERGWKGSLLGDLEGRLKQEQPICQISAFCSTHWEPAGPQDSVTRSFKKCVIEAVSSACQSQTSVLESISCPDLWKLGTLLSAVVTESWPRSHGEPADDLDVIFKHLLTGPDVKQVFRLYGSDEKLLARVTEEGKRLMAAADSVFTKVCDDLLAGTILVGQLELILMHSSQFLDIWELKKQHLSSHKKKCAMKEVLDGRERELHFLKTEKQHVDSLLKLCRRVQHLVPVDIGDIEARHLEPLESKRLCEAVSQPGDPPEEYSTHYGLSGQVRLMSAWLSKLKESHVFTLFWDEAAKALSEPDGEEPEGGILPLSEVGDRLFAPCFEKFLKLYQDLKRGDITFGEIDDIFKDFVGKYKDLISDLKVMCALYPEADRDWIPKRVSQIMEYHSLHQAGSTAQVISRFQKNFGLTGDFSVLHTLLNFTDDNHFRAFRHEKLDQISPQLIQAKKLLQEIGEPRRKCLEELSRQTELLGWLREALGGIPELKVFVDLASISAGENDIDVDRVACFHDAVQGYGALLYKLDRRAGFGEFMEALKELWKALENDPHLPSKLRDSARNLEWLKTVKESHGSVELSSLSLATAINNRGTYVIQAPRDGQKTSPDSVLQLILPESDTSPEMHTYSSEELKDLLNKLMLMSGKKDRNNTEVERFSEVFCGVQRLVQAFTDLYAAGNVLFRTWTAEVHCCPRQDFCVCVDFGLAPLSPLVESGDVSRVLEALCRQMELFLHQWATFVAERRAEHFFLNFYTAEQLVFLGTQLGGGGGVGEDTLTLLSFIKADCGPRDVALALRQSVDAGAWTLAEELPQLLASEFSLANKLRVIMEQSLARLPAFVPHCLDLRTLGRFLACLAGRGRPAVVRPLPRGLQAGRPNLVLCGRSEVLQAGLAVYLQAPGQPLPSSDEVLLCTPATPAEQVGLLLRRCLSPGAPGRGVYSLLFADQLSYEVGCQTEALFRDLCARRHREDYQLVLLCDAARDHCYLPAAFRGHRALLTPQAPLQAAQAYLARHFQVPEHVPSAAAVFQNRMCVGIVTSERAGVGKSLYVKRLHSKLQTKLDGKKVPLKVVRLTDPQVDENRVLASLLPFMDANYQKAPMIFHFDVTASVQTGIWAFLFKLLILRYLMDTNGRMWLRNPHHLYIIEISEGDSVVPKRSSRLNTRAPQFSFLDIFPKVTCRPPKEVITMELAPSRSTTEPGMDEKEFHSETFQRPFQYLKRFHQKQDLDAFQYKKGSVEGTPEECLQHFLIYCGVINPSWAELQNFARFLNCQLKDCEASIYCNLDFTGDTLRGFKNFVVTFMIFMARDFATPTLQTSDQSPGNHMVSMDGVSEEDLAPFSLRRRWESEPHPYVFFNADHNTMTFIGFYLQPNSSGGVDAINHLNGDIIKRNVMTTELYRGLLLQRVPFNIDFDNLPRHEKLTRLCLALGIQWAIDPDDTYELTTDNMLKILAIEMRFRCGIPVVIMGETGCGKTRLIKFLSDLRRAGAAAKTMKLVKVHGGTTAAMIHAQVKEAQSLALFNKKRHQLDTILFFDEANTTEAISCIKEVLCDQTVDGQPLKKDSGLHIIAACNPYRKHSQEAISRLESAGLGYRVRAEETAERLGSIPLRQLVYRVHALPPSLIPLVWDFGQLHDSAEKLYIQQIVQRLVGTLDATKTRVVTSVLSASQRFMRVVENECSFVSLRDVERCVNVFRWFYDRSEMLLAKLNAFLDESGDGRDEPERDPVLWSLVLAIGVCYHASLEEKDSYRRAICRFFPEPYNDSGAILDEITRVQDLFLNGAPLRKTIAKNLALKENVFMMIICIELKIPLFLVGKPGSSKSLAKTIVADAMQGQAAHSDLFRSLKQVHLVSFQCSPHSTPQGIIGTFKQCARFQQGKDLDRYVSVVVLDEVGLAEDSPKMPLKALHPLLEDGCIEDDPAPHKKVGFIGISNWALDPAKMNRGIFVSRNSPSEKELIESARGICSSDSLVHDRICGYFAHFAKAYETVCRSQDKEFFGLRDYYSLIKMVFAKAKASNKQPSPREIAQAVLRNFSGKDDIHALDIFMANLPEARCTWEVSTVELIRQNISGGLQRAPGAELEETDSRYLLVLTKNYVALQILQQTFFNKDQQPEIIFGSSFPRDQEYTQICRNINRVKICMETGKMVVLLNLQNLYESLYDALNQYYVYLGGQKYVDLGLGTHRVKCRVHPDFRLIVIEEKEVVYQQFPVPLINRLEKHFLDVHTVLEDWQRRIVRELVDWARAFADVKTDPFCSGHKYSPADVFIGYHSDACASVVLQAVERRGPSHLTEELYRQVYEEAKLILLNCATPDAVVRLGASSLGLSPAQELAQIYYRRQQHDSLPDFLQAHLGARELECHAAFTEITTFSSLLTTDDCDVLASELQGLAPRPVVLSLQQFDTEYSFLKDVRNCLTSTARCKVLIIQTDFDDGVRSAQLIASAKYSAINEINKIQGTKDRIFIYFITKLSRMGSGASYVGFHGGLWQSVHIDDLRRSTLMASDVTKLQSVAISQLFAPEARPECEPAAQGTLDHEEENMETETSKGGRDPEADMEVGMPEEMEHHASGPGGSNVLDTTMLLRSCVQSAVGTLRDQSKDCTRNMRRVVVLLSLLNDDNKCNASFLRISKMRLHDLLNKQEKQQFGSINKWVSREASNQEALQEAGTFRHTLWKRVQRAVTPLLASMVSVIDRDGNLELLTRADIPSWTQDLWMFIFSDVKLLNIPLAVGSMRPKSEMSSLVVHNYMNLPENASNDVPFSWRIKDYLEELWVQAQYIMDAEGLSTKLVEIFQKTPLGSFLAGLSAEEQLELLQGYAKDFLLLTMHVSTVQELELLWKALWSCISELQVAVGRPEQAFSLPWVHLAYQRFRTRLQNLSRILNIQPQVLRSLAGAAQKHKVAGPEEEQPSGGQGPGLSLPTRVLTLDVFAALACVETLTRDVLKPSPQAWLQMVKDLSTPLELVCADGYLQDSGNVNRAVVADVRAQWSRVFSVALFVEHVVLGAESQVPELGRLARQGALLLDKCLQENSDLKTHRPFLAVMQTLCECKDRASKTFSRFGIQPCRICLDDVREPVCLPCGHSYCLGCIRTWLVPGQMLCPYCLTSLPDQFSVAVSAEHRNAVQQHARFRQMCNSFFVDLVSTMCFKDNAPPHKSVVDSLLSLLFVQKDLLRDAPQRQSEHTKSLSPFDDVVDRTPVIRSVVLKLLLKYSFHEVKDYIQTFLSLLEKKAFLSEDKTDLYMLFISCLEDSIHGKTSSSSRSSELSCLRENGRFLQACSWGRGHQPAEAASVESLQTVARLRLSLDRASGLLAEPPEGSEMAAERRSYLRQVEQFCTRAGNDWYRVYLVRKLSSQRGMEFVQALARRGSPYQWVFPQAVLTQQGDHVRQMDRYLVHGDEYKSLRDAVGKAVLEHRALDADAALKACRHPRAQQAVCVLLALFREVAALYHSRDPRPEQCAAVNGFIEESPILSPPGVRAFAKALVDNTLPLLRTGPEDSDLQGTVTEMAVHAAVVLLCGQDKALEPLRNLAFSPDTMTNAFLPTMPEDLLAQAQGWKGLESVHWYTCPRGHPCTVGECGRPMEQGTCVDCGEAIGGLNHQPTKGFQTIQSRADRTQTGHVLGSPQGRGAVAAADREMPPVVFVLLRVLTHLAMLWGAAQSPQALGRLIKPPVRDPQGFLRQHIQKDLEQLTRTLGKSADEAGHAVHLVLRRLLLGPQDPGSGQRCFNFSATLSTKGERNNWEKQVTALLLPELEHLDQTLQAVDRLISEDERISSNPVARIIYGDPATFLPGLPQGSVLHCSKIWSCRTQISVENLTHVVERRNGREAVPLLWQFLQKEAELRLVKFLPEILALQRTLVKRFQNAAEDDYSSIRNFINSHSLEGLRQQFQDRISIFLSTWNALRRSLETNGEIKLPKNYCSSDLDLDADFEIILPRRRGPGLCSTALVSYLINLHNTMVHALEKLSNETNSYSVDASEVTDLHVISYEAERDLLPLILSNCQYQVEQGKETLQEFDLEKMQRQVASRLLQGKPRLTLKGIPTLVYRHDWNYEHLFMDIKNKMSQSPLPSSVASAVRGQLQSYSDACEALCVTEVTLGFLSTAGGDPDMQLQAYIQDSLQMGGQTALVLQALHQCQLKHTIALWQLLSMHKSEQLLRLKKDPFQDISSRYKADLSRAEARLLGAFLSHAGLDAFLLELHEMITLKLKGTQAEGGFNPAWSLRDTLVNYVETKDSEALPEVESEFPEEILLSSCVSVWKAAAAWRQDRQARPAR